MSVLEDNLFEIWYDFEGFPVKGVKCDWKSKWKYCISISGTLPKAREKQ